MLIMHMMRRMPPREPQVMPMDIEPSHSAQGASFSVGFETRIDQWMDRIDTQLNSMQSDIHGLTQDLAQFNINQERMRLQLDHQSQLLQDI